MKKSLSRLLFSIRFIGKNIISSPLKSILMVIGFLGIFTSFILGFSMRDFFTAYYYGKLNETYENIDLIMSVSPNGNTRFFSTSTLQSDQQLQDAITDQAMFFEFDVLLEKNEDHKAYVHVKASQLEMLKKINHQVTYQQDLQDDEMMITASLASKMELSIGDEVFIQVNEQRKTFTIVEVVLDDMLFTKDQIFIDKSEALPFFLNALSPSLASLNPALLTNIYNRVYIDVNETYDIEEVVTLLQAQEPYRLLTYDITIDDDAINQFIQRNITAFFMIISISLFAIVFVLKTTLEVYFHEKKQVYATIHILGGKKQFSVMIICLEMFVFFVISFVLSIILAQQIINLGLNYLSSSLSYQIQYQHLFYTLFVGIILLILVVYLYFKKFYQVSDVRNLNQLDLGEDKPISVQLGTFIILIIIYIVLSINTAQPVFKGYNVIFILVVIIYLLIYLIKISFHFLKVMWTKTLHKHIAYYHIKSMLTKTTFNHYLNLVFIAFLTILLLVFANTYMIKRTEDYQKTYHLDIIIGNVTKDYDDRYTEIKDIYEVKDISKAGLFVDVKIKNENQTIRELISMDADYINTYFNTNIDDHALRELSKVTALYIVLPDRYMYLYDYKVGDIIDIYVNGEYKEQSFVIAGFFEKQLGDLAFTNMHHVYNDTDIFNVFLINAIEEKETLIDILLDKYSQELIQVIDVKEEMAPLVFEMKRVTNYITFILAIIIICFLIALINHSVLLYHDMKSTYASMFVLGVNKHMMTVSLIKVFSSTFIILWMVSTLGYLLISMEMASLSVLFGEYEAIKLTLKPIWLGGLILIVIFSFNLVFFVFRVNKINASQILKSNKM